MEKIKENTTYKKGDVVVYGSQGICRITGTEKMRVGGKSTVYFILNPVYRKKLKRFLFRRTMKSLWKKCTASLKKTK